MCVDIDMNLEGEDEVSEKPDVLEVLESEVREAKEKGDGKLRWLELEGLDIDDDMLLSLDLSSRFPVSNTLFLLLSFIVLLMLSIF